MTVPLWMYSLYGCSVILFCLFGIHLYISHLRCDNCSVKLRTCLTNGHLTNIYAGVTVTTTMYLDYVSLILTIWIPSTHKADLAPIADSDDDAFRHTTHVNVQN
jgi:hypothetical protein